MSAPPMSAFRRPVFRWGLLLLLLGLVSPGLIPCRGATPALEHYQRLLKTRSYLQLSEELRELVQQKKATRAAYQLLALTYAAMGDWGRCQRVLAECRILFSQYEDKAAPAAETNASAAAPVSPPAAAPPVPPSSTPDPDADPTVYISAGGVRYHFEKTCAGGNAFPMKFSEVGFRLPCETCKK